MSINLDGYKALKPFRFWCQKVLPAVYDDSLSYYEVLGKLVSNLNTLIDNVELLHEVVGQDHEDVEEIKQGFETLKNSIAAIIAPNFADDGYYAAGSYVIYNNHLYQFKTTHEGPWTGTDIWSTSVDLELYHLYNSIASIFNPNTSYQPGDYVMYGSELYRMFAAYSGEWNSEVVQRVSVTDVLKELNTRDNGLNELLILLNEAVEQNVGDIDHLDHVIANTINQLADNYNTAQTYVNGDIVVYRGDLYEMTASGTTTGDFDNTKWTNRTVAELIESVESGSALPAVSVPDNLKTLKVVNGLWAVEHGFDTVVISGNTLDVSNAAFRSAIWNSVLSHITLIKLQSTALGILPMFFMKTEDGNSIGSLAGIAFRLYTDNYNRLLIDKWQVAGTTENNIIFLGKEEFVLLPRATGTDAGKSLFVNARGDWMIDEDVIHIVFTMTQTGTNSFTYSCNKTYAQIKAAIDAGKTIDCKIDFTGQLWGSQVNKHYVFCNPAIYYSEDNEYGHSIGFRYIQYSSTGTLQFSIWGTFDEDEQLQCGRTIIS